MLTQLAENRRLTDAAPEIFAAVLEALIAERGIEVDHTTVHRWIVKYSPELLQSLRARKRKVGPSWRMDETCIKVRASWCYLFRAVDRDGDTIDFYFAQRRDERAARRFLERAIDHNGIPARINIDGSAANRAAILYMNERIEHAPFEMAVRLQDEAARPSHSLARGAAATSPHGPA